MRLRLPLSLLTLWLLPEAKPAATSPPHIIFILADDMGWNDVSFHGSDQIPTYNIDSIGFCGIVLNNHYTQPVCSPTRSALLTGKYTLHTGIHEPLTGSQRTGLNLTQKILPQYFKELGYSTHMIGKWHLGFFQKAYTPLQRGFDSHFGYWTGAISYYDHILQESEPFNCSFQDPYSCQFSGHDFRRDYTSVFEDDGQYSTDVFTREAVYVIENHPQDKPLLLYFPHHAVHAGNTGKPLEAPQEEINRFSYITDPNRRTYAAMVSKLDQSVGKVIEALDKNNMLENSIIVFMSDNGAPNEGGFNNHGSNFPWRGQKNTLWQGGVRTPAAIWSPLIDKSSRVSTELMHVSDWLPTLLAAAGYDESQLDIDGVNQWQAISQAEASPRDYVVVEIDRYYNMSAIVLDEFKYLSRPNVPNADAQANHFLNVPATISPRQPAYSLDKLTSSPAWQALQKYSTNPPLPDQVVELRQEATITCDHDYTEMINCTSEPCLFHIETDPCEQYNVADLYPSVVALMEELVEYYKQDSVRNVSQFKDPEANPALHNYTWSIWEM